MSILRGLLGGTIARRGDAAPPPTVVGEVEHRVLVQRPPATVWHHLVSPAPSAELGVDCVRLLPLPANGAGELPEFVGVWRRSNGRLWAGVSTVVELVHGHRIVTRSADGTAAVTLTTTLEPLEDGCVLTQQLRGDLSTAGAAFAHAWLVRSLLAAKADIEGRDRCVWRDEESDELVGRVMGNGVVGPGVVVPGAGSTAAPVFTPVSETATVDVAVSPERLWQVLGPSSAEQLLGPAVQHLVRAELADEPGREHVIGVHRRADGRRSATVSLVVEAVPPARVVERELTTTHESDVVTTIEARGEGSRLTETFTGWLPSGPGRVVDTAAVAAFMRTRLAAVKNLAEGGARPQRDPRTGFLPPGQTPDPVEEATGHEPASPRQAAGMRQVSTTVTPRPARGGSVPSSVVLPPPHVPDAGEAYDYRPDYFLPVDTLSYFSEGDG